MMGRRRYRAVLVLALVLLAAAVLSRPTLAWYRTGLTNFGSAIRAADYALEVRVTENGREVPPQAGGYQLTAGSACEVTLRGAGRASTGYCVIACDGTELQCTGPVDHGAQVTLTFTPGQSGLYTFTAVWGAPPQP